MGVRRDREDPDFGGQSGSPSLFSVRGRIIPKSMEGCHRICGHGVRSESQSKI